MVPGPAFVNSPVPKLITPVLVNVCPAATSIVPERFVVLLIALGEANDPFA
jgi:hypothetical protein